MSKIKVALLSGGISGEREVSLKTGDQIFEALNKEKYDVFRYDTKTDLKGFFNEAMDGKFDVVFPALHGEYGEDGRLQGMLDMIDVPYVFSGCLASALAMNKHKAKIVVNELGLNVASNIVIEDGASMSLDGIVDVLSLPIVVKPLESGSSVGMSIVKNTDELKEGIELAFESGNSVMLEKFVEGREFTVAVLGNGEDKAALPVIEIIPKAGEFYDFESKYESGGSEHICPADISDEMKKEMQKSAVKIYEALGCRDLARVDFIWSEDDNKGYFLEINTIPGMTVTSLAPEAAKEVGINFEDLLDRLIGGVIGS